MSYVRKCDVCANEFGEDEMMHTLRSGVEPGEGYVITVDFCNDCGATLPEPFQHALADMEDEMRTKAKKWTEEHEDEE